jgi:hypothetical protein
MKTNNWLVVIIYPPKDDSRYFYRVQSEGGQPPTIDSSWILVSDANNRLKELLK